MSWDIQLDDQLLQDIYAWIDQIPLSRPKKRIEKDFSDGGESNVFFSLLLYFTCAISLFMTSILFNIGLSLLLSIFHF